MTTKEKQDRIDYLEREIFILEMKDRWDAADYSLMDQMKKEQKELEGN